MMGVTICAVGRLRQKPEALLVSDYINRFNKLGRQLGFGPANLIEVEDKTAVVFLQRPLSLKKLYLKDL